jgi:RNA polymerase sigma factor (sigma-70 family)
MANGQLTKVVRHLCRLLGAPGGSDLTDRQLLERFTADRDEEAFATLVARHAPLVLGVSRRVLGNEQDAEDVFQAAFLLLARKAGAVRWHESVGNWLYSVAYHLASRLRLQSVRRRKHEREAATMQAGNAGEGVDWQQLGRVLDDELERLPEKYRMPLLLCYLHGKTRDEAAEQLGWTLGEIKGRLERGRELLRGRLMRRGLTLSAALLPTLLAEGQLTAAPASLLTSTLQAAVTGTIAAPVAALLREGVQAMFWAKIKVAALLVLSLCILGSGAGAVWYRTMAGGNELTPAPGNAAAPAQTKPADPKPSQPAERDGLSVVVTPAKAVLKPGEPLECSLVLKNASKQPRSLHLAAFNSWQCLIHPRGSEVAYKASVTNPAMGEDEISSDMLAPGESRKLSLRVGKPFVELDKEFKPVRKLDELRPGKYSIVFLILPNDVAIDDGSEGRNKRPANWTEPLTANPVEFEIAAETSAEGAKGLEAAVKDEDIAWGDPVDGIRFGLSPRRLELGEGESILKLRVWFENTGRENVDVPEPAAANLYRFMFAGEQAGKPFFLSYRNDVLALPRGKTQQLAPGKRYSAEFSSVGRIGVEDWAPDGTIRPFYLVPKIGIGESVTLRAGLLSLTGYRSSREVQGEKDWNDPGTKLKSGPITVTRVKPAKVSEPAVKDGLSISVTPAKAVFTEKEPLEFTVAVKNVSTDPLLLYDLDDLRSFTVRVGSWQLAWMGKAQRKPTAEDSRLIKAGESVALKLRYQDSYLFHWLGPQDKPVPPRNHLPAGKYQVAVSREFTVNPALQEGTKGSRQWTGNIATNPLELEILADRSGGEAKESQPTMKDGLSVTVTPAKAKFAYTEPLLFTVVFANTSKEALNLLSPEHPQGWKLNFDKVDGDLGFWVEQGNLPAAKGSSQRLEPGKSLALLVQLSKVNFKVDRKAPPNKPDGMPGVLGSVLPGRYRVTFTKEFQAGEDKNTPWWTGEITGKAAEVEINAGTADGIVHFDKAKQPAGPLEIEIAAPKPPRTLNDFQKRLDKSLTPLKAETVLGKPDRITGSGLLIYVYDLDDGTKIWLGFGGFAPIVYAHHVQKDDGKFVNLPLK